MAAEPEPEPEHGHAGGGGGSAGLLAQLHAERVARQPLRTVAHPLGAGRHELAVVEQHGVQLGSSLWHSALPLCDWLCARPDLWPRGRRVAELGAGCGACGIAAALAGGGGHTVALTDKPEVCEHLRRNVAANTAAIEACGSTAAVAPLLWRRAAAWQDGGEAERELAAVRQHGPFTVLIACEWCVAATLLPLRSPWPRSGVPFACGFDPNAEVPPR